MNVATSQLAIEMSGVAVSAMREPDTFVVEQVNWSVAVGDFWALAGFHGSGKSDLLLLTAGLMAPARGSYRLFGGEMPEFEDEQLRERLRVGLVSDHCPLFNHLSVAENIALPLRYHEALPTAEITDRVKQLLALTELTPHADRAPSSLGRNWRKRASLARALALQPEILLVDNPLGGADVRDSAWWLAFLAALAAGHDFMPGKRRTTLVVAADDFRPWQGRASHFAVLRDGHFEVLGGRAELAAAGHVKELLADHAPNG